MPSYPDHLPLPLSRPSGKYLVNHRASPKTQGTLGHFPPHPQKPHTSFHIDHPPTSASASASCTPRLVTTGQVPCPGQERPTVKTSERTSRSRQLEERGKWTIAKYIYLFVFVVKPSSVLDFRSPALVRSQREYATTSLCAKLCNAASSSGYQPMT